MKNYILGGLISTIVGWGYFIIIVSYNENEAIRGLAVFSFASMILLAIGLAKSSSN